MVDVVKFLWAKDSVEPKPQATEKKSNAPDWLLDNIAEASKNARSIYFLYLGFLAYCALTVVSTTDRQIILNETARLPIVNLDIPLNGFFITAPIIAIIIFGYFQLYLHRIKGLMNDLRQNYACIGARRLYPWMLNIAEEPEPGLIGTVQKVIAKFSLWWSLPIILSLIAFWFVKKHEPILSYILGASPLISMLIVLFFWCNYESVKLKGFIQHNPGKIIFLTFVIAFEMVLLFYIIPRTNQGISPPYLRKRLLVDLSYQKLSSKPSEDYDQLYWLNLEGVHLEGAKLTSAILKRANLHGAHLQRAQISRANLEQANLEQANLQNATLFGVNLQRANLKGANLQKAHPWVSNLQEANFEYANLQEATLMDSRLQKAKFRGANLQKANLRHANLEEADLSISQLQEAKLFLANLARTNFRGAKLWRAKFQDNNLQGANFRAADLREVQFIGVNLQEADLSEANLQGSYFEGVSPEEVKRAQKEGYRHVQEAERLWLQGKLSKDHLGAYRLDDWQEKYLFIARASNLQKTDMRRANLRGVNFGEANLQEADLRGADLHGTSLRLANLQNADLQHVQHLTVQQLSQAYTLYQVKLDPPLLTQLQKYYPHLLLDPTVISHILSRCESCQTLILGEQFQQTEGFTLLLALANRLVVEGKNILMGMQTTVARQQVLHAFKSRQQPTEELEQSIIDSPFYQTILVWRSHIHQTHETKGQKQDVKVVTFDAQASDVKREQNMATTIQTHLSTGNLDQAIVLVDNLHLIQSHWASGIRIMNVIQNPDMACDHQRQPTFYPATAKEGLEVAHRYLPGKSQSDIELNKAMDGILIWECRE